MTIDEILATMPEPAAEGDHDYLVIDPVSRTISVPDTETIFGVTGDELADRKYFLCPRIVGDNLDLAGMFIRVNFRNANGEEDGYLVKDVAVTSDGDYITFSWQLWPKVAAYKGTIQFGICADLPNTSDRRFPDWNTTMANGEVLEGLDPDLGDVEAETSDVVTQLRAETAAQTAAVAACGEEQVQAVQDAAAAATAEAEAQVAAKGVETLATIPEDYTTMAGKVNEHANAIKGQLSGEIIRADDVSPVEHYMAVTVRSKNLIPYPFSEENTTRDGVTFTANEDGSLTVTGTPTQNTSFNLVMQYKKGCRLEKGKTYTLTVTSELTAETGYVYFQNWTNGETNMSKSIRKGSDTFTLTQDGYLQLGVVLLAGATVDQTIYCQLEEGAATEYVPYVDPSTVTLTRCGKNILPWPYYDGESYTTGGITYTVQEDGGIHAVGTATANSYYRLMRRSLAGLPRVLTDCTHDTANLFTYVTVFKGETVDKVFYPQVELGTEATSYEKPVTQQTAMPAADGTVGGLTSNAPTLSIFADVDNVVIDCKYNRDTNAVYAEILAKIAALSG